MPSNLDISTINLYMARKVSPLILKERFRPTQQLLNQNCRFGNVAGMLAGMQSDRKFKFV
jgi:hypothetical protein